MYGTVLPLYEYDQTVGTVVLTWSEQDASGKEKRPSSILNRIKNVFPQMKLQRVRMNEEQNTDFWHNYQFLIPRASGNQ